MKNLRGLLIGSIATVCFIVVTFSISHAGLSNERAKIQPRLTFVTPMFMTKNLNFQPKSLIYFDDMESSNSQITGTGFWHRQSNPQTIAVYHSGSSSPENPPNDINPDLVTLPVLDPNGNAFLPAAYSGSHVWWYGVAGNGTFIDDPFDLSIQAAKNGGRSIQANNGDLILPPINLSTATEAFLQFLTWWEIEGVDADSFDMMYVLVSTDGGFTYDTIGALNPLNDVNNAPEQNYSSGGSNTEPLWVQPIFDLTPYAGNIVNILFRFQTVDPLYNGFRGWLIDDIAVYGEGLPVPAITSVSPSCVVFDDIGATIVNIYGDNFADNATVTVGGTPVTQTAVVSSTHIQIILPALSSGTYDITVTNPDNQSATLPGAVTIADTCGCRIYFDTYHGYGVGNESYSQFFSYFNPDLKNEPITEASLSGYNILAIFGPSVAFSSDELSAINAFAANGGRVVVLGEWGPAFDSYNAILEAITLPVGIDFNSNGIYDATDYYNGNNYWPILHVFGSSPIISGLNQVVVLFSSSLTLSGQAEGLMFGDSDTYVQMLSQVPGDVSTSGLGLKSAKNLTSAVRIQSIKLSETTIVAAARAPIGKGDIIVIGDSDLFADYLSPLSEFDNLKFAQNIFTCTTPGCTEDDAGQLDVVGGSGNPGSSVTFTVRVQNAPNAVDALGFEVTYDPAMLQYVGFTRGGCVTNFDFFNANLIASGIVRCGGFTTVSPIPAGANCDVVQLHFTVISSSCAVGTCPGTVSLQNLVDDMTGWSASHGCFCCGCVCDINGDGNCTPQDALCSFQKYLGICPTSCGPCEDICCDVNKDGACTPADALCRFQEYLGIHPNCFD